MHIFNSLLLYLEIYLEVELMGHQEWKFSTYLDKSNYLCKFSLHHLLPILDILSVLIFTSLVEIGSSKKKHLIDWREISSHARFTWWLRLTWNFKGSYQLPVSPAKVSSIQSLRHFNPSRTVLCNFPALWPQSVNLSTYHFLIGKINWH